MAVIALCATLVVTPVIAQDDAYEAAIASGDIASLIPEEFASVGELKERAFTLPPALLGGPDAEAALEEFDAILGDAGLSIDDVVLIDSGSGDESTSVSFSATHIPGVDVGDWFELLYETSLYRRFHDGTRQTDEIGPKPVLRLSPRRTDSAFFYYAMGEILWRVSGDDAAGRAFIDALPTVEGAALGATEAVAQIGTEDDPLSQIPAEILGEPAGVEVFPMAAMVSSIDPDDEEALQGMRDFEALLADAGAGFDQAELIAGGAAGANIIDGLQIFGLHVDGVDQSSFIDGVIASGLGTNFDTPQAEAHELGGKDVFYVTDAEGSQTWEAAYVYGVGETVWILRGNDEYLDALLSTMP